MNEKENTLNSNMITKRKILPLKSFSYFSFALGIVLFCFSIVMLPFWIFLVNLHDQIPITVIHSALIFLGLIGAILGGISLKEVTPKVFAIFGVILNIFSLLINAFGIFVLYNDAGFSVPL